MKQKRTYVTLLLVMAFLCLGIAYAAITAQELTITGNATAATSNENFKVRFAKDDDDKYIAPTTTGADATKVTAATVTSDTAASFTIEGLTTEGQTATITYTIENASPQDIDANVTVALTNGNQTWYTATVDKTSISLNKGQETTVAITVTLKDTPATDAEAEAAAGTFTVTLTANAK